MILEIIGHDYLYAIEHIIRIFYPHNKIEVARTSTGEEQKIIKTIFDKNKQEIYVSVALDDFFYETTLKYTESTSNQSPKLRISQVLFKILLSKTGKNLPWGMLTGVRPISLFHKQRKLGKTNTEIKEHFSKQYWVSDDKINLAILTMENQIIHIDNPVDRDFCLYISIPFCPSRCSYCSFISSEVGKDTALIDDYLGLLLEELKHVGLLAKELDLSLNAVYIGGGTPTILSPRQLGILLNQIGNSFDVKGREFTLEAGRPDTITEEKLLVAKSCGVNRISINPQSLNQSVLDNIGRKHTVGEFYAAFELARQTGFSVINTDLILGLQGETENSFNSGLENIISLKPDNITIHTLTIKRAATLKQDMASLGEDRGSLIPTLSKAEALVMGNGYLPYYLYRQKNTVDNLENLGFATAGNSCYYNLVMMEETESVIAVGAGANTRLKVNGNIKRIYNYKYPLEYIKIFDNVLLRKGSIKEFYEKYR